MKLYGIPNCDSVKKARKFLDDQGCSYEFIDFKKKDPTAILLKKAKKALGQWPVNKRGTTYRKIKAEYEEASSVEQMGLLIENSSAIKRPLVEIDNEVVLVGLDLDKLKEIL